MKELSLIFLVLLVAPAIYCQTRELRIIEQPKPDLPKDYGTLDAQGTILLKVEFLSTGKIGKVAVVSKFTSELPELAVAAAQKIRFEPKLVGGKAVDSFKIVEYSYSFRNGGWRLPPLATTNCGGESYDVYRIYEMTSPRSKLQFMSRGVARYEIPLPTQSDFQGFAVNWVKRTPTGFDMSVEWGSRIYHEKDFFFVCQNGRFYLERITHSTFDKADPSKWSNSKRRLKVRLQNFKINDFMQD